MKSSNIKKHIKFEYDQHNDLLYIFDEKHKVDNTLIVGDFHIEINENGNVVGVEVLNASDILKVYSISKEMLSNIDAVDLKAVVINNSLIISIIFHALNQEKSAIITMNTIDSPVMRALAKA